MQFGIFTDQPPENSPTAILQRVYQDLESYKCSEYSIRKQVIETGSLTLDGKTMRFCVKYCGSKKPPGGYTLVFGFHGGGGCESSINDCQWNNHKKLYKLPSDCIWVTPRSVENVWNMWHLPYMDDMIDYLIQSFLILDLINPDRVFLTGYSAGSDGAYRLGARMADRFAGVGAMAGHPGNVSPLNFRNLAFTIQMGELDHAYDRNKLALEWANKLNELKLQDPKGYNYLVQIHSGEAHWMHSKDASSVLWLLNHVRDPIPSKVVWKQCEDVPHSSLYWLAVPESQKRPGTLITAYCDDRRMIHIKSSDVEELIIRLNDALIDYNAELLIYFNNRLVFQGVPERSYETARKTVLERVDHNFIFFTELLIRRPDDLI